MNTSPHDVAEPVETESIDPRIRRTRQLLVDALGRLLETTAFERISIQQIADAATVNRVTFYDHYPDKFALLDELVAARFHALLDQRGLSFDCGSALSGIVLAMHDFLTAAPGCGCGPQRQLEPHLEAAVIRTVRELLLVGLRHHPNERASPELLAATVSWAMYGAVREWLRTPDRCPSQQIVATVVNLITPLLHP